MISDARMRHECVALFSVFCSCMQFRTLNGEDGALFELTICYHRNNVGQKGINGKNKEKSVDDLSFVLPSETWSPIGSLFVTCL